MGFQAAAFLLSLILFMVSVEPHPVHQLPQSFFNTYKQDASSCWRKLEGQVGNLPVIPWSRKELEACVSNFQLPEYAWFLW